MRFTLKNLRFLQYIDYQNVRKTEFLGCQSQEIADRIAEMKGVRRMSAQAVGHAVGHNPISLIIPCHRVIGADGSMTGYAGGIDRKIKLLEMERADTYKFNQFH